MGDSERLRRPQRPWRPAQIHSNDRNRGRLWETVGDGGDYRDCGDQCRYIAMTGIRGDYGRQ